MTMPHTPAPQESGTPYDFQTLQALLVSLRQSQEEIRSRVEALETGLSELKTGIQDARPR